MFRKKHTQEEILIKRVSTELRAFVDVDSHVEDRVMAELKDEGAEETPSDDDATGSSEGKGGTGPGTPGGKGA